MSLAKLTHVCEKCITHMCDVWGNILCMCVCVCMIQNSLCVFGSKTSDSKLVICAYQRSGSRRGKSLDCSAYLRLKLQSSEDVFLEQVQSVLRRTRDAFGAHEDSSLESIKFVKTS